MRRRRTILAIPLLLALPACQPFAGGESSSSAGMDCAAARGAYETLDAVLWKQTAAEYQVLARSVYAQAAASLDAALADRAWTAALEQTEPYAHLPPAIVVDVDETVLDNSRFHAQLIRDRAAFGLGPWKEWIDRAEATAVPGAVEYLRYAAGKGVEVFYVTNRAVLVEAATRRNLVAVGAPVSTGTDAVLTRGELGAWGADKASRRRHVAGRYRVLAIVGDDLNDFIAGARDAPEQRRQLAQRHSRYWGTRWFLLPNPVYGSWERALYDHDRGLSEDKKRERKLESLHGYK